MSQATATTAATAGATSVDVVDDVVSSSPLAGFDMDDMKHCFENLIVIDAGANLTNKKYSRDLDSVIQRAKDADGKQNIKKEKNYTPPSSPLVMQTLDSPSPPPLQTHSKVKIVKKNLLKQTPQLKKRAPPSSRKSVTQKLDSTSPSRQQKQVKFIKKDLQKQTDEFLRNCSQSSQMPLLKKQASPSPSPSSSNSVSLSQVQSQLKAADIRSKIAEMEQELIKLTENQQHNNGEIQNEKCNKSEDDVNEEEENGDENMEVSTENQLFGKHFIDEEMVLLSNNIYCKKRILCMAEGCSYKASHIARRLLEGVYKKEAIANYTFTGKSPKQKHFGCLDPTARKAIIGVQKLMVPGTSVKSSKEALRLSRIYPDFIYSTAGIHPHDSKSIIEDPSSWFEFREIAGSQECVAIGPCGLDYQRDFSDPESQKEIFEKQLLLASNLGKSILIHERSAQQDVLDILDKFENLPPVIIRSFMGTAEEAIKYLDRRFYISLTGYLCKDKSDTGVRRLLDNGTLPLDRLLVETDSPFMYPNTRASKLPQHVKTGITERSLLYLHRYCTFQRNEPCSLPAIVEMIAAFMKKTPDEVALATAFNALKLFGLS